MKKIILFMVLISLPVFASDKLHVKALNDFSTADPNEHFKAELVEDANMGGIFLFKGDILNCSVRKVTEPKRAKRDAKIYFLIKSYKDNSGEHEIPSVYVGKFAKNVISPKEVKKFSPKKIIKTTAGTLGNIFITNGFSQAVSFVDGVVTNENNNRLKSGFVQVYKDSPLSYVEYGNEVLIKENDEFYLIVKEKKE